MNILKVFKTDDIRSKLAQKNIVLLFANKIFAAFISLQLIPAAIGYVDTVQYGIWITLSSLVSWMVYFDFGLTHGFRNGFASAKAKGDFKLAKQYVTTSYLILAIIFIVVLILLLIINQWLTWSELLNVSDNLEPVLNKTFIILVILLAIQMILNLFTTLLLADQKPALSALIVTLGQFFALAAIYWCTLYTKPSLLNLATSYTGIPVLVLLIFSIFFFKGKYKEYAPSFKNINLSLVKDIIGLGSKFFIIQLSMLFVFQFANFIIMRIMGAESVTAYTIVYKYFSIIYIVTGIIFLPFWSAFTEAYAKKELQWMQKTYVRLSKIWFVTIFIGFGLFFLSPIVYKYWLAKDLHIDYKLSIAMAINMIILARANLYMVCLNGIGKVFLQMIIYVSFAFISIPMMYFFTGMWGFYGILLVTSLVYLAQAAVGHKQLKLILKEKDYGVWSK